MKNAIFTAVLALGCCAGAIAAPNKALKGRVEADFPNAGQAWFVHYVVPAMGERPYMPDAYPEDGEPGKPVTIVVARDEYEPGSFLVCGRRSERAFKSVQLSVGELRNENGDVFPAEDLDLKVVKVWWQNKNAWISYFGDTGWKLVPELLLHDENLIRVDEKNEANYARVVAKDGKVREEWLNPPRQFDGMWILPWLDISRFRCMREGYDDAKTLQPVSIGEYQFKQFFLTAHARKDTKPGVYRGVVKVGDMGDIPVVVRVLGFVLPQPRAFVDPTKEFLVSSISDVGQVQFAQRNGYDWKLARKQLVSVLKNKGEHNMSIHMVRGAADPLAFDCVDAMREAGLRTDVLMGWAGPDGPADGHVERAKRLADDTIRRYGHKNGYLSYGDEPGPRWFPKVRPVIKAYQDQGFGFYQSGHDHVFYLGGYFYDWQYVAKDPSDPSSTRLWNAEQNRNRVCWYAVQHTGSENPAFNRRQNGLTAWLSGYTVFCNYIFAIDSYNDNSVQFRPMVQAYGCASGVIDTLQWEGFREGVDDIRYATLMADLARKAQKFQDTKVRYLGGQAMMFLTTLDVRSFDMNWARSEMIRYIEELSAHVAPFEDVPEFKPVSPAERAAATKRLDEGLARDLAEAKKGFAAAKNLNQTNDVHRKVAEVYSKRYFRWDEAGQYLVDAGLLKDAVRCFRYTHMDKERDLYLQILRDPKSRERRWAFWDGIEEFPEIGKEAIGMFEDVFFGSIRPADTNGFRQATRWVMGEIGRSSRLIRRNRFAEHALVFERLKPIAARWGVPVGAEAAFNACAAYLELGDCRAAAKAAESGLKDDKAASNVVYRLQLASAIVSRPRMREQEALAAIKACDAKNHDKIPAKMREQEVKRVGAVLPSEGFEDTIRALDAFRLSLYCEKPPKKRYVVKFSDSTVEGVGDWSRVSAEEAVYDRRYGGGLEFLETDVVTGNRGEVGTSKETMPDPTMKVVADANGLHFFFCVKDPKAQENAFGKVGGGSFEAYLAPGENEPYVCFLMEPDRGTIDTFNTTYNTFGRRWLADDTPQREYRFDVAHEKDCIISYLFLSWRTWATNVPKDGSVWDFENMFWNRMGNFCWNGTESIHGRSTWGELEFRLTDDQRRRILTPLLANAFAKFRAERFCSQKDGLFAHWKDEAVGDPEFYEARLKELEEKLLSYGELLKPDMSASTVDFLSRVALPQWEDLTFEVQRRRARWLRDRQTR